MYQLLQEFVEKIECLKIHEIKLFFKRDSEEKKSSGKE